MPPDLENQSTMEDKPVFKGYLKKLFTNKKDRYFVLKDRPYAKLEYFESEKKYNSKGSKPKRTIDLRKVWNIDKKTCAKHKHIISIYTQNEYFAMAANNKELQEKWVNCLQNVTAACNTNIQMYRHIWKVVLDNKEIEQCNNSNSGKVALLHGPHRCCITDNAMVLIKLDYSGNIPDLKRCFEIKFPSIRTCGHRENRFFIEPGRLLSIGTGKLWMELEDSIIADSMHQTILSIMYSLKSDARPRSDSASSVSGRTRTKREYNPPPSKVGMGKTLVAFATPASNQFIKTRTRCESFPATPVAMIADEARYRTSSEGETTLRRFQNMKLRERNNGGNSPGNRIRLRRNSFGKRFPPQTQYNTMSYHGSCTSSSSLSSMDHHCGSSTVSENMSSDEYSSSPCDHFHRFGRSVTPDSMASSSIHEDFSCSMCHSTSAPPPPDCPPLSLEDHPISLSHDYVNTQPFHLRSQSMDDNLGTMETSSLSTAPNMNMVCSWQAHDSEYSQMMPMSCTATTSDEYVQYQPARPMETDEYAPMAFPTVKMDLSSSVNDDYASMTPGKPTTPISVSSQEKEGYVAMRPCSAAKSLPQDIDTRQKLSLYGKMTSGSYSPKSDYSRSPDKSKIGSAFRRTKRLQSDGGTNLLPITVDVSQEHAMPNYCPDNYAIMNPSNQEMTHFDENSYLEMSPMSVKHPGNSTKASGGIFHALLSVAAETKPTPQYPHQIESTSENVESNSLNRKRYTSRSTRRQKSLSMSKIDRKLSLKIVTDTKPVIEESKSASPGGEYVNIDYQKALQHPSSYLTASPSLLKKFRHKTLPNNAVKLS